MRRIRRFFDLIIPRFITEDVAFVEQDGYVLQVCPVSIVPDGEALDYVGKVRSLNLFGFGVFPKVISDLTPWGEH